MTREELRAKYPNASESTIDRLVALERSGVDPSSYSLGELGLTDYDTERQGAATFNTMRPAQRAGYVMGGFLGGRRGRGRIGRKNDAARRDQSFMDAAFSQQTDEFKAGYMNADGTISGEKITAMVSQMGPELRQLGWPEEKVQAKLKEYEEQLYDQAATWRNSPQGKTAVSYMMEAGLMDEMFPQMQAQLEDNYNKAIDSYDRGEAMYEEAAGMGLRGADYFGSLYGTGEGGTVVGDEEAYQNRIDALGNLMDVYKTEGMTEADKAAMELAQQGAMQASRATREAATAQAAREGRGGGGMDYMLRMQARQQGSGDAARAMMQSQIAARQRAAEALQNAQQGYGQAFNDRTGQQAQRSQLIDDFNKAMAGERGAMLRDATLSQRGAGDAAQNTGKAQMGVAEGTYSAKGDELTARRNLETQKRGTEGTERAAEIAKEQEQQSIGLNAGGYGVDLKG